MTSAPRAHVRSGRLVLDDGHRAELDAILDDSLEDVRAGRLVSNEEALLQMERAEHEALTSR